MTAPQRRLPFLGFLAAEVVSMSGTQMTLIAVPWLVLSTTGSAALTGSLAFVETGAFVLAKALGAPAIDRLGRRRVAIGASLTGAVVLATVPALYAVGSLPFAALLAIMGLAGGAHGLGDGAIRVLLPDVAEASGTSIDRATAAYDGVFRASMLLGPPLAGVLIAAMGAANVLLVDAASFAILAVLVAVCVRTTAAPSTEGHEPYLAALRSGWRFVRSDRLILSILFMLFFTNMIDRAYSTVYIPVWIRDSLTDPAALGLLAASFGLGAVGGNLVFTWLAPRMPRYLTFACCFVIGGSPRFFSMAFSDDLWLVLSVCFTAGLAASALNPILSSVTYEIVPREMQARVFGLTGAICYAGMPVGGLLGGLAVQGFGGTVALALSGTLYLAVTLLPFVQPVWRRMNRGSTVESTRPVDLTAA